MFKDRFKKELKTTIKLAVPIIIAQLGVVLMGVTDNVMVGRLLGKVPLGASGIANSIAFLISSLAVGGMSVVAPMVSKYYAEKDPKGIKELYVSTMWVTGIFSVVLTAMGYVAYANFKWFQQPDIINQTSPAFLLILILSNIPLYYFISLKQFSDGLSQAKVAMMITTFGLGFNIVVNYLLITGTTWWAPMGLLGAAYATFLTRLLMAVLLFAYFKYSKSFSHYFSNLSFIFNKDLVSEILKRSIPGGSQFFFEIAAFSFAVIMMGWISETALAAHQIAINIASTTYMMATGISFAGGIRVGEAWGQRSPKGIRTAGYASYFLVLAFMGISMILILLFDNELLGFYIDDHEVIAAAVPLLAIAAFFQLSDGFQVVGLGVLRGLSDIKIPTIITFVAYWCVALPLGYFLGFKFGFKAQGIWWGLLVGLSLSGVFLYARFNNLTSSAALRRRFVTGAK